MNSFYTNIANRAYRAIMKRGVEMVLRRTIPGTRDENTGTMGTPTVTNYVCYGLIQYFDSKASALMYGTAILKDSLIHKDDQMILLAAANLAIVPNELTDALIYGGVTYQIVNKLPLNPGGQMILYNVHVRK